MNANYQKNTPKKNSNIDLNPPKKIKIIYEKQLPLEDFVQENHKELKQYICHLCTGVLVEPVMDTKGHIFCKKCLLTYEKKHTSKNKKLLCPISNHILKMSDLKPYELISVYLCKMICVCPNKKKGCKWEGKYNLRKEHIEKECKFIDEEICPNEGCGMIFKIDNINTHLLDCNYRKINCEKCDKTILFKDKDERQNITAELHASGVELGVFEQSVHEPVNACQQCAQFPQQFIAALRCQVSAGEQRQEELHGGQRCTELMRDVRQGVRQKCLIRQKCLLMFVQAQGHFPDLGAQNSKLALAFVVRKGIRLPVQDAVDVHGELRDRPVAAIGHDRLYGKQQNACAACKECALGSEPDAA